MIRCLCWFSIERTTGLILLVTGFLLFLRPYASAVDILEDAWAITITLTLIRTTILLASLFLIWKRVVGRVMFVVCLMPMIVYAIALLIVFFFRYNVGAFGFIFGLWACGMTIYVHSLRGKPDKPEVQSKQP